MTAHEIAEIAEIVELLRQLPPDIQVELLRLLPPDIRKEVYCFITKGALIMADKIPAA